MARVTNAQGRPVSGQMPGVVEAIVTDNQDPDQMGRIKVKFPTLPDAPESTWARLGTPMAGQDRGWVTLPEVDDEVLVAFMHGDINHAVIVGALYNGTDTPPYANDDGDNNLRVFYSRSGHKVTFDDSSGSEKIVLETCGGDVVITMDASEQSLTIEAAQNVIIEAGQSVEINCQDFTVSASMSVTIEASQGATLSSSTVEINGDMSITISGQSGNLG